MKKSLIAGALIVVIGVSTFFAQKEVMKIADIRADEIYSQTVAQAVKALPRTTTQRIVNTPEEKKFLTGWVKQEFKDDTYTEKTVSGTLLVMHDHQLSKEGSFVVKDGEDIHELYLKTPTETYKVKNVSYPAVESLNGIEVSLTGFLSSNENKEGQKTLVVNISGQKIKTLKPKIQKPVKDWTATKDRGGSCGGNYCALVVLIDRSQNPAELPSAQDIHNYIFDGRIKDIFLEQSYGQMIYDGNVTDWIEASDTFFVGSLSSITQYLIDNAIDLNSYDQIMYLVNNPVGEIAEAYGSSGASNMYFDGEYYSLATAQMDFDSWATRDDLFSSNNNISGFDKVYIHETGHNLGVGHDSTLACENGITSLPSECIYSEYGNQYSIMGQGNFAGHFSFLKKMIIGWLDMDDLVFISAPGTIQITPIEALGAKAVAIDSNSDLIPEYILEKRASLGIDTIKAKSKNYKIDTALVYKIRDGYSSESSQSEPNNPLSWDSYNNKTNLVDMTPPQASMNEFSSLLDATLNTTLFTTSLLGPGSQYVVDTFRGVKVGATKNSTGGTVSLQNIPLNNSCVMRPMKVFRFVNNGFGRQLPKQGWPQTPLQPPAPNYIPNFSVDVGDVNSSAWMSIPYLLFNDDSPGCTETTFVAEIIYEGNTISTSTYQLPAWSGGVPYIQSEFADIPTYGLTYGQYSMTLRITKMNDYSQVSYDLVFNLIP